MDMHVDDIKRTSQYALALSSPVGAVSDPLPFVFFAVLFVVPPVPYIEIVVM